MKKHVLVVDGAVNSTFEVFKVSEEQFNTIFPNGQDVAFLSDYSELEEGDFWLEFYANEVDKKTVCGIHGTLHSTGSYAEKEFFPTRRETDVR